MDCYDFFYIAFGFLATSGIVLASYFFSFDID